MLNLTVPGMQNNRGKGWHHPEIIVLSPHSLRLIVWKKFQLTNVGRYFPSIFLRDIESVFSATVLNQPIYI